MTTTELLQLQHDDGVRFDRLLASGDLAAADVVLGRIRARSAIMADLVAGSASWST